MSFCPYFVILNIVKDFKCKYRQLRIRYDGRDNLVPLTTEKARKIGAQGGKASGEAKRKKKLLSEVYAEVIAEMYGEDGGELKPLLKRILKKEKTESVSLLKGMVDATEGSKIEVTDRAIVIDPVYKDVIKNEQTKKENDE